MNNPFCYISIFNCHCGYYLINVLVKNYVVNVTVKFVVECLLFSLMIIKDL